MILIPWFQTYTFFYTSRGWRYRSAAYTATVITGLYLYLLSQCGIQTTIENPSLIESGVMRMSMVGVTVISILSGFGMAHTPLTTWYQPDVSEQDCRAAERALAQTDKMIQEKKAVLERMSRERPPPSSSSSVGRLVSSFFGQDKDQERTLLQTEVDQLEALAVSMKEDLEELERGRARSRYAQTWKGKVWTWAGKGFAVYCVYRFSVTTLNVILKRQQGASDPITQALSMIISHVDRFQIDPRFWSQQLSFWFAGIIVFGSVRSFLKLVTKVLDIFMLQVTFSTTNVLMLTAQVMGMYFLSSVLMIQINLPPEYRYLLSSSLQSIEFDLFKYWSDAISIISCVLSFCIIYVLYQTQNATTMARDFADVELLTAENGFSR
ncbi:hypothetical protein G6F46_006461 [Rhizopus delemar]|nr:hypothetical protein G6F43_001764 [Rhizopus delemar]KAG1543583.1 hypothetical protein G6F51_006586 [Rhizopus arrhizus]KAG1451603.1 hypothetical protein G6F55_009104 [Rhizopus delemar]KAG1496876.1 hypothetical protein G6F54_006169 [Rhizopus delemar]KAG1512621.1 hypothetical protein G6F53_005051 [Rhizopus delemar]